MDDQKEKLGEDSSDVKKEKINAIWEQLNAKSMTPSVGRSAAVPAFGVIPKPQKSTETAPKSSKAVPNWMVSLGIAPKKPSPTAESGSKLNQPIADISRRPETDSVDSTSRIQDSLSTCGSITPGETQEKVSKDADREEIRRIAAAALASARAATKASTDGKMEISEVRDFAGEEVKITKFVDPYSKVAVAAKKRAEMQAASSSGLDALLQQIGKKQKLNILDKSRKDWGEFKEDKGIEVELEMHKKSGDTYTEKVAFLQRADVREYERERDARLALMSKRRNESSASVD
ncbi:hypothetical protein R1flu_007888 [Riccia fluitans]|uniref:BCNT-C domain-containing protein n=1 Tax=Riccia fluitans TaxID=41844 RepID=A0ABD1Z043_9MARC